MAQFTSAGIRTSTKKRSRFLDALVSKNENMKKTGMTNIKSPTQTQLASSSQRTPPKIGNSMPSGRRFSTSTTQIPPKIENSLPKPRIMTGTAEVYSRQSAKTIGRADRKGSVQPLARPRTKNHGPHAVAPKEVAPRSVDPSWIFPVGSKVKHQQLGEGVVLPLTYSDQKEGKQDIFVRFGSGEERCFSLHGSDISPIV